MGRCEAVGAGVIGSRFGRSTAMALGAAALLCSVSMTPREAAAGALFISGDLVISEVGRVAPGDTNTYTLDQATAIKLQQYSINGTSSVTAAGSLLLSQTSSGLNSAISGEFGSASEGILQLSGNGNYLTIMGYGINAATFNSNPGKYTGSSLITALGQSTSLTSASASIARVVGLIDANGTVDTSTALKNIFNTNNPRSAYTVDGKSFYVSGQGASKTDPTQGVFYAAKGATTATAIDNSTDTRVVTVIDGKLYVSRDYNPPGSGAQQSNVGTLTNGSNNLPTNSTGIVKTVITPTGSNLKTPTSSPAINLNAVNSPTGFNGNNVNGSRAGASSFVYASPEQFFFASKSVLYVADSGAPKNGNVGAAALGDGGLQKWVNSNPDGTGTWRLAYTLYNGLNLVNNDPTIAPVGTSNGYGGFNNDLTGLFALTGKVIGGQVELFATSYGKNELDTSYLFGITDSLGATTAAAVSGEKFQTLVTSDSDVSIRGVSFAPAVPEASTWAMMLLGFAGVGFMAYRRKAKPALLAV